jgi:sugar phosphate isomerase/epimerase
MKLGISSYTYVWWAGVPGYPQPARPLTARMLLDVAASLGVQVVQIADNLSLDGLPPAAEISVQLELGTRGVQPNHLREYLDIARSLRSPLLRTLLDVPPREAVAMLREVASAFERAGVTLAIENHDLVRAAELRRVIEGVTSPAVGVCLDTANSLGCGEGIDQVLDTLADFVVNVHLKDFTVRRLPHSKGFLVEGVPAGSGLLDIPSLLKKLPECSLILEQWPPPEATVEESIAKERAWAEQGILYLRQYATTR